MRYVLLCSAQHIGGFAGDEVARPDLLQRQIGRASCRERVCLYV